jgi:hypothetical protein
MTRLRHVLTRQPLGRVVACGQFFMSCTQVKRLPASRRRTLLLRLALPFILLVMGAIPLSIVAFLEISHSNAKAM